MSHFVTALLAFLLGFMSGRLWEFAVWSTLLIAEIRKAKGV